MQQAPVIIEQTLPASKETVWQALTSKEQMKEWYFDLAAFSAKPGFTFSFTGTDNEGKEWLHHCEVIEVIPNEKLSYTWRYDGCKGVSLVSWELLGKGANTHLRLTHSGLETFPPIKSLARENFVEGWHYILSTSLKNFLEKQQPVVS
ncbi:MAG TPA: SRPBCC domain-containing protein [Flavisolibacter sp.]|nr:SRPBCC domain-containing protein [Flavisolibacter sp.]